MPTDQALTITEATRDDVATFVRWAAAEGWDGLEPSFETARMYAGAPPLEPVERIFGVSSLELG